MDAVKMEGGSVHRANAIRHVVNGGGKIIHIPSVPIIVSMIIV